MLYSPTTLLTTLLLTSTTTTAFPTRTQCRCTLVSNFPQNAVYTPSAAHWTPLDPSTSPLASTDKCASLGPELESFKDERPDLYEAYISLSSREDRIREEEDGEEEKGKRSSWASPSSLERSASRRNQRIICRAEEQDEAAAYGTSLLTLYLLQFIVAITILACVAEAAHLGYTWCAARTSPSSSSTETQTSQTPHNRTTTHASNPPRTKPRTGLLRLHGAEKLLLAVPRAGDVEKALFSPGADKKMRAYETSPVREVSGAERCECNAYETEDDDEMDRPVM